MPAGRGWTQRGWMHPVGHSRSGPAASSSFSSRTGRSIGPVAAYSLGIGARRQSIAPSVLCTRRKPCLPCASPAGLARKSPRLLHLALPARPCERRSNRKTVARSYRRFPPFRRIAPVLRVSRRYVCAFSFSPASVRLPSSVAHIWGGNMGKGRGVFMEIALTFRYLHCLHVSFVFDPADLNIDTYPSIS